MPVSYTHLPPCRIILCTCTLKVYYWVLRGKTCFNTTINKQQTITPEERTGNERDVKATYRAKYPKSMITTEKIRHSNIKTFQTETAKTQCKKHLVNFSVECSDIRLPFDPGSACGKIRSFSSIRKWQIAVVFNSELS